ncbi:hypothetical protein EIP91_003120 [Steccherinum ochraceum]|uniref:SnoaL-like domain-containing protein n=1 Tax=Steccherinum ochraceum TaxID=92696 RepID=A0A4V6N7B7_9APHY|nr:hypothetical protein EIP91_003120 [Steccherinum ochraceum]
MVRCICLAIDSVFFRNTSERFSAGYVKLPFGGIKPVLSLDVTNVARTVFQDIKLETPSSVSASGLCSMAPRLVPCATVSKILHIDSSFAYSDGLGNALYCSGNQVWSLSSSLYAAVVCDRTSNRLLLRFPAELSGNCQRETWSTMDASLLLGSVLLADPKHRLNQIYLPLLFSSNIICFVNPILMAIHTPADVTANPSSQLQAVLQWVEGMSTANFDLLDSVLADDYVHITLPTSLNIPELGSKEQYIQHYRGVLPIFTAFDVAISEVIESPGRVLVHASANATTKVNVPYANEYIIIFSLAEQADGSHKLTAAKEFVDSKFVAGFMEQMANASKSQ